LIGLDEWEKLNDVSELAHGYVQGIKSSSETAYRNRAPLGMAFTGRLADLQTVHVFWRLRVSPCKQIQSLVTLPTAVLVAEQQDVG
jgi:hypothetical protein